MEKTLYNQVGEIKGASSETEDSFSFQFTPQNDNLKRTRGSLFTLVSISGKTDNRYELAKNIYHQFQSSYYAKATGSILHGLSDTLEQLVKGSIKKEEESGLKISLIAAVFWGTVVYLSKHGEGAVYVARGDKVKKLDFAKVASGVLEDQDTVCLTSEKFTSVVTLDDLTEALTKEKFEDSLESLDQKVTKVEGAVADVIRLSVNAPKEAPEALAIAAVDEHGEIEETKETAETPAEEALEAEEAIPDEVIPVAPATAVSSDPFEQTVVKKDNLLKKIWIRVKGVALVVFARLSKPWRRTEPGEPHDPVATRRARIIQITVAIVLILIISLGFGVLSKGSEEKDTQITQILTEVEANLDEAASIKTIDPTRALALVDQAQVDLEEAKKLDSDNQQIKELSEKSSDLEAEITKTTNLTQVETLFDFNEVKDDTTIADLALLEGQMVLIDESKAAVFSFDVSEKNASEVSGSALAPQTITAYPGGFYLTGQAGITKIDSALKLTTVGTNANWGKIVSSSTYQNNLYLLDTEKNEIWRYLSTSTGLASARAYISGEKPSMSDAVTIAIDDLVWVATKDGTVFKFAAGRRQEDFMIDGLADPIGELSDMFTSTATKNHYFLDKGKGRVIVAEKTGVYLASYAHDDLHKADNLWVDESAGVGYFTASSKLYQFKLP